MCSMRQKSAKVCVFGTEYNHMCVFGTEYNQMCVFGTEYNQRCIRHSTTEDVRLVVTVR